jgi:indolepyruvate decarboxylase
MNITEALLHALKERGAREVWGIPGDFALPYFKIIEQTGILPLVTLTHEPGLGFAADAAARIRRGLGVAAVTYGAGAINMLNAVAQAFAEKSPLVVVSGAPGTAERARGLLLHHQVKTVGSQFRMYQEVTCDQGILDDPATAPAIIERVLRSCLEHSRPVYLEIPRDMPAVACGPVAPHVPTPCDAEAVAACAAEVLARLRAASRPVLMVGVEVRRYGLEDRVAELADRLGVPVVTSFMGRGLLAGKTCLQGTYMGVAGDASITQAVEGSDGLLLLGVIMSDTNFGVSASHIDRRRLMHAEDREVRMGFHTYHDIPLEKLVDALLAALPEGARACPAPLGVGGTLGRNVVYRRGFVADDAPVTPDDIAVLLNDFYDGVMAGRASGASTTAEPDPFPWPLACDIGDCLFTALSVRPVPMVGPGYYASMGFGVPAGMGLQIHRAAFADPGGRRGLPDDRHGAWQLRAPWHRPRGHGVQQRLVGDAAGVPAGNLVQRHQHAGLRRLCRCAGRARPPRDHPARTGGGLRCGHHGARALPTHRRAAGKGRHLRYAGQLRGRGEAGVRREVAGDASRFLHVTRPGSARKKARTKRGAVRWAAPRMRSAQGEGCRCGATTSLIYPRRRTTPRCRRPRRKPVWRPGPAIR